MGLDQENFLRLFRTMREIDLFGTAPPAPPWGDGTPSAAAIRDALAIGEDLIPLPLQTHYVEPLNRFRARVLASIGGDVELLETLTGAVYQHADADVAPDLHRFLAVISNFYRSFLSVRQRLAAGFPLTEQEPPLAMFQHRGQMGPFTITVENIAQLTGGSVGVVSLPATFREHPVLWASLAHETGGHDVLHADPPLLPELERGVQAIFGGGPLGPGGQVSTAQLLSALWSYWIDESASDVYGVMNIGPTFGHNLAVFFAAMNAQPPQEPEPARMRTFSGPDGRGLLDPHPTDLLRLDLILGAVQALVGLEQAQRAEYASDLRALSILLGEGATTIQLHGILPVDGQRAIRLNHSFPLADMQAAARRVGAFIATGRLAALDGHSIQDLETWDDPDETTARTIADSIAADTSIAGAGDDAQLLAGATLALLKDAGLYEQTTRLLNDALDESFERDPIWGVPQRDLLWLRGNTVLSRSILTEFSAEIVQIDGARVETASS